MAHTARIKEGMNCTFWFENRGGRDQVEKLGVCGENIIKMDFREVGFEGVNSIELAQDRDFLRFL